MARFIVVIAFLAFCNIVYALPTWENEDEADFSSSSLQITRRRCSCSDDHHKCGCCLQIRAPAFQNYDEADVCMNSSFVPSPLAVDFFMMWNKRKVFNRTVSDSRPRPACFDIPRLNYGKACVKFTKITIKRDHTGGCAALELKSRHSGRDIPLGCFFFHGRDGHGVDMETFLDPASFMSLLKNVFQASKENQIDSISLLANPPKETLDGDVTEVMAVDKASCQCSKAPAQCDCCAEFKIFGHSVKACAHADIDSTGQGFDLALIINGHTIFKKHISIRDPPEICHTFHLFTFSVKACLKITQVSLKPGHTGACLELDVSRAKLSLGCFYGASYLGSGERIE
ncbi:uncharacterized protein LOC113669373 [Pocillopora damicornis]|nr:uncharacterized protein LOC113669373 [Pocillopora damicornis]